jgi:hypothetical protein
MTPNEIIEYLMDQVDHTHKAICIYLEDWKLPMRCCKIAYSQEFILQPFDNHHTLTGAGSVIAVDKEITNDGGENKATGASDHYQFWPESETATAVDKEVTKGKKDMNAGDPSQTRPESEVINGGDPSRNGLKEATGLKMVSPGEGGPADGIDLSQKSQDKETDSHEKQKKSPFIPLILQKLHHHPTIHLMILAMML